MGGTARGDFLLVMGAEIAPADFLAALGRYPQVPSSEAWKFLRIGADLSLAYRGDVEVLEGDCGAAGLYQLVPDVSGKIPAARVFQENTVRAWAKGEAPGSPEISGRFCFVLWDGLRRRVLGCTDPFKTLPLFAASAGGCIACATDLRLLLAAKILSPSLDEHALYHYLNLGYVPSPFSALRNVSKIPPGSTWVCSLNEATIASYWEPEYPEDLRGSTAALAAGLRREIIEGILRYQPDGTRKWGTFLSGGTDSTAIAAVLSSQDPRPDFTTFSIGFEESSYSELQFVRIAAARFGLQSREKIMDASEALAIIPRLLEGFDEPFGNPGAIPSFACVADARAAGAELLLAGDGGDEIFGGNDWYRKNRILGYFSALPAPVKHLVGRTVDGLDRIDSLSLNRIRSFLWRAKLENPERLYAGESFASLYFADLLTPDFRSRVHEKESLEVLRETFLRARTPSELHRLMYLDLERTLADSDLVKVGKTSKIVDVSVSFPYLDPALVDYTGRLPESCKLRGLRKRYLFRRALHNLLPPAILRKKKHGFDVPVSSWFRTERSFQELLEDVLFSQKARERGYFEQAWIRGLWERHRKGNWDYSIELYRLLMLELWTRSHLDVG